MLLPWVVHQDELGLEFSFDVGNVRFQLSDLIPLLVDPAAHVVDVFLIGDVLHLALQMIYLPVKISDLVLLAGDDFLKMDLLVCPALLEKSASPLPKRLFCLREQVPQPLFLVFAAKTDFLPATIKILHFIGILV